MTIKNLVPWNRKNQREMAESNLDSPFFLLHRQVNRLFDDFFSDFPSVDKIKEVSSFNPKINISENDHEIHIEAELPGIEEKDLSLEIKGHTLILKGEKKFQKEEKKGDYHLVESSFGSFSRSIELPEDVELDKVEANLKNGVTTITIPKKETSKVERRKIDVKSS